MLKKLQDLSQKSLRESELDYIGEGNITKAVEEYLYSEAKRGKFSTTDIVSRDPMFNYFYYCYKTLQKEGFKIKLTKNGEKIVKIKVSWEINEEEGA